LDPKIVTGQQLFELAFRAISYSSWPFGPAVTRAGLSGHQLFELAFRAISYSSWPFGPSVIRAGLSGHHLFELAFQASSYSSWPIILNGQLLPTENMTSWGHFRETNY